MIKPVGGPTVGLGDTTNFYPGHSPLGTATTTAWVSSSLTAGAAVGIPGTYVAYLVYGPATACSTNPNQSWDSLMTCPGKRFSNTVRFHVGTVIGPGSLVASSAASGQFANASVATTISRPNALTLRVISSPSGQNVHIAWDVVCTKGFGSKGASGTWDDVTPVNDSTSITVPYATLTSSPDSCVVSIGASLVLDDSGQAESAYLQVRLYVNKSHL